MFSLTFGLILLGLAASAQCLNDDSGDFQLKLERDSRALKRLNGFNVFDVLKKLDICYLKCKNNYCECCQKIKILLVRIEVCGTGDLTPSEKIAHVGLKVAGLKLLSTKVKLERHLCRTIKSKIGSLDVCVDTNVLENEVASNSFPLCFKVQVSYEGIPSALFTIGCPGGNENVKEQESGEYHSVSTLKVLNGEQVAKAIQKIADGNAKKG